MTCTRPACLTAVALLVVIAIALDRQPPASSSTIGVLSHSHHHDGRGEAEGAVPAGTTVFDDRIPGVARLDPALRAALRRAGSAAAGDRVRLLVDSGWRSRAYQQRLFREAVAKYGSEDAAARWVATPDTSAHVHGDAVDIGPPPAAAWLEQHGAAHGLCRVYDNEPWHFELRDQAPVMGCPARYADAAHDPRMRR